MAGPKKALAVTAPAELPVREIKLQHPKQWLLVGVTRRNEREEPTHGCLLYSSKDEDKAFKRLNNELSSAGKSYDGIAIFWADPRFPDIVRMPETA